MAYSMDLRRRVVAALEAGESMWSVAQRFAVAHPTVRQWRDRAQAGRLAADKPGPTGPRVFTEADDQLMREQVAARPGITAKELRAMLSVDISISAVCRRLIKLGLRLKKSR
jgi:putative transposase